MKIINTEESKGFQPIRLTIEIETKEELLDLYSRIAARKGAFLTHSEGYDYINNDEMVLTNHLAKLAEPYL